MREIKFRTFVNGGMWNVNGLACSDHSDSMDLIDHSIGGQLQVCDFDYTKDCVLMQYTGLRDKNGKEIYEEDIVSFDLYGNGEIERGTITFNNASFVAQTDYSPALDGTHHGHPLTYELGKLIRNDKDVEVIGNIYENPDLLE